MLFGAECKMLLCQVAKADYNNCIDHLGNGWIHMQHFYQYFQVDIIEDNTSGSGH